MSVHLPAVPDCPVCEDLLRVRWSSLDSRVRGGGLAACPACLFTGDAPIPVVFLRPYQGDEPKEVA